MARKLIGVAGKKRSGKDTLCVALQKTDTFERLAFATAIWDILLVTDPWVEVPVPVQFGQGFQRLSALNKEFGYEYCKANFPDVREYMKKLGSEGGRDCISDTVWLDIVVNKINRHPRTNFIVTDVRFDNEAEAIQRLGGLVVKLDRNTGLTDSHVSESYIDNMHHDVVYENNGDIKDLQRFAVELVRSM